jgi:hypothetical protein
MLVRSPNRAGIALPIAPPAHSRLASLEDVAEANCRAPRRVACPPQ